MRILLTGGRGVIGRSLLPLLQNDGHQVITPGSRELDLFDPVAVRKAVDGVEAVYHLATRIPPPDRSTVPGAWDENDRLRSEATPILVDAALQAIASTFILPSVTFMYPPEGPADEDSPVETGRLGSMLKAEEAVGRFAAQGRRGVVLRLGLLWGPGTGNDEPSHRYNATLHVEDAATALVAALAVPSGIYNAVGDGERVSAARFKAASGWAPLFRAGP